MAKTPEITRIVYQGSIFRIEFYVKLSGDALAEDWLESQSEAMQAKFAALFAWMGDQGRIANERKFKHLTASDQIFEFKADDGRILCFFFFGKRLILTHGFRKKGDKTPKGEIERAEILKREFESRSGR
jgi:hypothetical protein